MARKKVNPDTATTVAGAGLAVLQAAQPALKVVASGAGSLHQGDYISLGVAALTAILGYYSNKGK